MVHHLHEALTGIIRKNDQNGFVFPVKKEAIKVLYQCNKSKLWLDDKTDPPPPHLLPFYCFFIIIGGGGGVVLVF